ncbi:TIGR04283 family arsenosugar biosynthesis glycosyltransferase [Rhodovulum sp. DZ06]|uniref:TIGR04283 family arsenosugar biosynthesis glycosyltransferase n=1 Tax=Rhodovulum sp. DZ06 TaxID=3425126 RepID=UPI003D354649
MSAPISVVIPTLNAADRIGPCLGALSEALLEGLLREVILVDGGSEDAIGDVAEAVGAKLIEAPRGRGTQLAAGAAAAQGAWLLFLHADTVPGPGWVGAVQRHMMEFPDRAGWFRLRFDDDGFAPRAVAGWANLRSGLFGLPYGDQGLLVPRSLYRQVGGFPEIPLMEDVALARRLKGKLRPLGAEAATSAERYRRDGWLRRGARNLSTLGMYAVGVPPETLAKRYERR